MPVRRQEQWDVAKGAAKSGEKDEVDIDDGGRYGLYQKK